MSKWTYVYFEFINVYFIEVSINIELVDVYLSLKA